MLRFESGVRVEEHLVQPPRPVHRLQNRRGPCGMLTSALVRRRPAQKPPVIRARPTGRSAVRAVAERRTGPVGVEISAGDAVSAVMRGTVAIRPVERTAVRSAPAGPGAAAPCPR